MRPAPRCPHSCTQAVHTPVAGKRPSTRATYTFSTACPSILPHSAAAAAALRANSSSPDTGLSSLQTGRGAGAWWEQSERIKHGDTGRRVCLVP